MAKLQRYISGGLLPLASLLPLAGMGCKGPVPGALPPQADRQVFEAEVFPLLARDCAFPACHGNRDRFFRIYRLNGGPRAVDAELGLDTELTGAELEENYNRAVSMLAGAPTVEKSLLLCKPLEVSAGGCGHEGVDRESRNVYATKEDPRYQTLLRWAQAARDAPALEGPDLDPGPGEPTPEEPTPEEPTPEEPTPEEPTPEEPTPEEPTPEESAPADEEP